MHGIMLQPTESPGQGFILIINYNTLCVCFLKDFRGEGREKVRCVRDTSIGCLLHACPQPGASPITQTCSLTGNRTSNLSRNPGYGFGSQAGAQATEPYQPGHMCVVFIFFKSLSLLELVFLLEGVESFLVSYCFVHPP